MATLGSVMAGCPGRVAGFDAGLGAAATQRLREMGLDEGVEVLVLRRLPLGGPVILSLGTTDIALRPAEARLIRVDT